MTDSNHAKTTFQCGHCGHPTRAMERRSSVTEHNQTYEREFHASDGWWFARRSDGSVVITSPSGGRVSLSPNTWASVVANVSHSGETSASFLEALDFHQERLHKHG